METQEEKKLAYPTLGLASLEGRAVEIGSNRRPSPQPCKEGTMDTAIVPAMSFAQAEQKFETSVHNLRRHDITKLVKLAMESHVRAEMRAYQTLENFAAEGRYLEALKRRMPLEKWEAWLGEEYWKGRSTAYRYITLAKHFALLPKQTEMGLRDALVFIQGLDKEELTFIDLDENITAPEGEPKWTKPAKEKASEVTRIRRRMKRVEDDCWENSAELGIEHVIREHLDRLGVLLREIGA